MTIIILKLICILFVTGQHGDLDSLQKNSKMH